MKITKFVHSCLLVEMPAPVNRTALFDPGMMSETALDVAKLEFLDDIFITHEHGDHLSMTLIKQLLAKFPNVRITAPQSVVDQLSQEGISASNSPAPETAFFDSPHEPVMPLFPLPDEIGVHYLNKLTHPGDSHSFKETKTVLALPVTAPWGSAVRAVNLAIELKPAYVIPIHDWHWNDNAREMMYENIDKALQKAGIQFIKAKNGEPFVLDV